ncbi:MAG: hypothetical protein IGS38_02750 [Synechococcales cyanobacterium M58_A2018_015]|nr:hypothetical protein [Synechococcales cyanobacterium M58_A2018_015]
MDLKRLLFSALVCAGVGAVFGLAAAQISPSPYQSQNYINLTHRYPWIGAAAGFCGGGIISAVQQLNEQYDRQNR